MTWLGQNAKDIVAVVEYLGNFPGLPPHGNSKSGEEYIRTPAHVMTEMSDMLRKDNPLNVYSKLTNKHEVTDRGKSYVTFTYIPPLLYIAC